MVIIDKPSASSSTEPQGPAHNVHTYAPSRIDNERALPVRIKAPAHDPDYVVPRLEIFTYDQSYSMSNLIEEKGKGEKGLRSALTRMDITKVSAKVATKVMNSTDKMMLNAFSRDTVCLTPEPIEASAEGKEEAMSLIERLKPTANTMLFDAILTSLEQAAHFSECYPGHEVQVTLMTDGCPTDSPAQGHVRALEEELERRPELRRATLDIVAFGPEIDVDVCFGVARLCGGQVYQVSDAQMLATVLSNRDANKRTTYANNVEVRVSFTGDISSDDWELMKCTLLDVTRVSPTDIVMRVPSIRFDQDITIMIPTTLNSTLRIADCSTSCTLLGAEHPRAVHAVRIDSELPREEVAYHTARHLYVRHNRAGEDAFKTFGAHKAQALVTTLINRLSGPDFDNIPGVPEILSDARGETMLALSDSTPYQAWGNKYLPMIAQAHMYQYCINFKDPGVQEYGGEAFRQLRSTFSSVYNRFPPPVPTGRVGRDEQVRKVTTMAYFNNRCNACYAGHMRVTMADGSLRRCDAICRGDQVRGPDGSIATVRCVVRTRSEQGHAYLAHIESSSAPGTPALQITPYHPVRTPVTGEWAFPHTLGPVHLTPCEAVYSFVLDQGHVLTVNGFETVSLGHHLTDNDVVSHPYFGSDKCVEDLQGMMGWEQGLVPLSYPCMARENGVAARFIQNPDAIAPASEEETSGVNTPLSTALVV